MKPERIATLADGIFAIAMTLLILDLHVPASEHLAADLLGLWPKLLSLVISFLLLAIYWSSHHLLFARLEKSSFTFMWRNIRFLLVVTLVPFATSLLGEHPYAQSAQLVYGAVLIACALILYRCIYYAIKIEPLYTGEISLEFRRNVAGKVLIPPALYIIALLISFWRTDLTLALFVLAPLIYFVPIDSKTWTLLTKPLAKYIV